MSFKALERMWHEEARRRDLEILLRSLPQAKVIDDETRAKWLDDTLRVEPERVEWHIERASGFGGSEAGLLLEWATRNESNPVVGTGWGTVERLVRQKLLQLAPDAPGVDARRGIALEPVVNALFEESLTKHGRTWTRRDDVKAQIEHAPHPRMPWLRASLDGVYEIDGDICIVDFKAPSEASLDKHKERLSTGYIAQLNHYALVAHGHGVRVGRLMLAMLDYRRFGEEPIAFFPVENSAYLQTRVAEGGRSLWHDHVLTGMVPAPRAARSETSPELAEALLALKQVRRELGELTARKEALSEQVLALMTASGHDRAVVDLGNGKASVSLRMSLDADRVWERLSAFCSGEAEQARLKAEIFVPEFREPEAAARWVIQLRDDLSRLDLMSLPESLRRCLGDLPEVMEGKMLPQPARQALRAIGEEADDFEKPTLQVRF